MKTQQQVVALLVGLIGFAAGQSSDLLSQAQDVLGGLNTDNLDTSQLQDQAANLPEDFTEVLPENAIQQLQCNETGFYLNGSECLPCEAGNFCPLGTTEQFSCDYRVLIGLEGDEFEVPCQTRTVQQMFTQGEPMAGNYCPGRSIIPNNGCWVCYILQCHCFYHSSGQF
eukprot:TRINITY_DN38231_c0_g1_i1.p4 TRINITY_DN38231_c0_g1~~TRINITY_DN38231_c0_g1_i1.p4  ORF type:complete len:169 (-),score=21.10 TRINITY_DN38231_c0_g1_i1:72-578(-)